MVGIICFWDRYATPYLRKYEELLRSEKVSYEVVLWNRTPKDNDEKVTFYNQTVTVNIPCSGNKIQKGISFLAWKSVVKKIISERNYRHLIILSTVPAVLLFSTLLHNYKEKYLFDIRDYTLENNYIFRKIVMNLVHNSVLTAISSKGYMKWLDASSKITVNHNITVDDIDDSYTTLEQGKKIVNFAFVGNVRLDTQTVGLMHALKNNERIEQHFYGRIIPSCRIKEIAEENDINNIFLHGVFDVSKKKKIFRDVDLINCVYANSEKEENIHLEDSTPLPNRLYDALMFNRPIIASRGTYLAELVKEYNLGCNVNGFDSDVLKQILEYVDSFNPEVFLKGCNELRTIVLDEENKYIQKVRDILRHW